MKILGLALSFLTTIPFPSIGRVSDEEMSRTIAYFPLVGVIVGAVNGVVFLVGLRLWSPGVAAWLWLIANALITGGLHIDGWMDTFDALGSRKSRSEMLAIMKDSRIGAMGGMAAILLFGLKWSLLASSVSFPAMVFLVPVVGRSAVLLSTQTYSYIREKGLGHAFTQPLGMGYWAFALLVLLVPLFVLVGVFGVLAALIAIVLSLLWAKMLSRKFGGLTGDNYGALNEVTEVLFMLIFLLKVS